jgi:hypothetical protein
VSDFYCAADLMLNALRFSSPLPTTRGERFKAIPDKLGECRARLSSL